PRGPRARTPWRPSANCPTRNRQSRRSSHAAAEHTFGRRNGAGPPRVDLDRLAQGAGEAFEARFDDVVIVLAVKVLDVQREPGRLSESLKPFLEQLGIHFTELWPGKFDLPDQVRPVRRVEADPRQGLVHRNDRVAVARDAAAVAERPRHGFADDVAGILR